MKMDDPIKGIGHGIERMRSPKYWRDRAERLRAKANNCASPETREALRTAAKNYNDLARSAEETDVPPKLA
jgi:hypothetical protein